MQILVMIPANKGCSTMNPALRIRDDKPLFKIIGLEKNLKKNYRSRKNGNNMHCRLRILRID